MKIQISLILSVGLFFSSCVALKSPTGTKEYGGAVKTCLIDSTAILNSPVITIVEGYDLNASCPNRPDFGNDDEMRRVWPVYFYFRFQDKEFWYMCKPEAEFENGHFKSVAFSTHDGNFILDKKRKTIKLSCIKFTWEKTFNYTYDKKNKTLVLTELTSGV